MTSILLYFGSVFFGVLCCILHVYVSLCGRICTFIFDMLVLTCCSAVDLKNEGKLLILSFSANHCSRAVSYAVSLRKNYPFMRSQYFL